LADPLFFPFSYVAPMLSGCFWLPADPKKSHFFAHFWPLPAPTPFFPVFLCGADPFGLGTLKNPQKPLKMTGKHQVFDDFWKIAKNPHVAPIPFFQKTRKSAFFCLFSTFWGFFGFFSIFLAFFIIFDNFDDFNHFLI